MQQAILKSCLGISLARPLLFFTIITNGTKFVLKFTVCAFLDTKREQESVSDHMIKQLKPLRAIEHHL